MIREIKERLAARCLYYYLKLTKQSLGIITSPDFYIIALGHADELSALQQHIRSVKQIPTPSSEEIH